MIKKLCCLLIILFSIINLNASTVLWNKLESVSGGICTSQIGNNGISPIMRRVAWNKLERLSGSVIHSEVGADWATVGTPTFSTAKFGNGVNADAGNYGIFEYDNLPSKFTIDFFVVLNSAYGSDTEMGYPLGHLYTQFCLGLDFFGGGIFLQFYIAGSSYNQVVSWSSVLPFYSPGDKINLRLCFDTTNPNGVRVFCNGVESDHTTLYSTGSDWTGKTCIINLNSYNGFSGIVDDFVMWDDVNLDFTYMNVEGREGITPPPSVIQTNKFMPRIMRRR